MADAWGGSWGTSWAVSWGGTGTVVPPTPRAAPPDAGGAGYATGPAFPKRPSVREMYRQPRRKPDEPVEVKAAPIEAAPVILNAPELSVLMGHNGVALGITAHEQILADDDEAIFAILSAQ